MIDKQANEVEANIQANSRFIKDIYTFTWCSLLGICRLAINNVDHLSVLDIHLDPPNRDLHLATIKHVLLVRVHLNRILRVRSSFPQILGVVHKELDVAVKRRDSSSHCLGEGSG